MILLPRKVMVGVLVSHSASVDHTGQHGSEAGGSGSFPEVETPPCLKPAAGVASQPATGGALIKDEVRHGSPAGQALQRGVREHS